MYFLIECSKYPIGDGAQDAKTSTEYRLEMKRCKFTAGYNGNAQKRKDDGNDFSRGKSFF